MIEQSRAMRVVLVATLVVGALSSDAQVQPPFLLKDLNPGSSSAASAPLAFTEFAGGALFFAADAVHGSELWRTDGTSDGTFLVRDVVPGVRSGRLATPAIVVSGAWAYFVVPRDNDILELWKSDGTTGGTTVVDQICSGCDANSVIEMVDVGGTLYFAGADPVHGLELWRSDGTAAGTFLIEDIFPGVDSSQPSFFENLNGTLFFSANDGVNGRELWKSDGTALGTEMVANIAPGGASSSPEGLTAIGSLLYFKAASAAGTGLWTSDGEAGGTTFMSSVVPIPPGQSTRYFFEMAGSVAFFGGASGSAQLFGVEANIVGLLLENIDDFSGAAVLNGEILVSSSGQLWKSDGVSASQVLTINSEGEASILSLTTAGSRVFFTATDGVHAEELWTTDGTTGGTSIVLDIRPGALTSSPSSLSAFGSNVIFSANNGSGAEPWLSDGTAAGTSLLKDANPNVGSGFVQAFHAGAGAALIRQTSAVWGTNGTTPGTSVLATARFPQFGSAPGILIDGTYFFAASDTEHGVELWKSDGTPAGTLLLEDICVGVCSSAPSSFATLNGALYFSASGGNEEVLEGPELWRSDGTAAGTVMVRDLVPGEAGGDPQSLTVSGGRLFFTADDGINGIVLWKSDGTLAGTVPVTGGNLSSSPQAFGLMDVGGTLFFFARNELGAFGLWKTDGSSVVQLMNFDNPHRIVAVNGTAIFSIASGGGYDIWKSDGTEEGTVEVSDSDFASLSFVAAGSSAFFTADDGAAGVELWRTDGSTTQLVKDICPGSCSPGIQSLVAAGAFVYFQARDDAGGEELWRSDGSEAGTVRVADIEPGTGGSSPTLMTPSGNRVYFKARTLTSGEEPWVACTTTATAFSATIPPVVISGATATLTVTARDATATDVPCYAGTVHLSTSDPAATVPANYTFVGGEGPHTFSSLTLRTLGSQTITVTDTVTGSLTATVQVTVGASPVTSTITAAPATLVANGSSTSLITVRYKDASGSDLSTGGGTLTLTTTRGTISPPVDQGNGTYRATLTSSTVAGPATISGVLNGTAMTNTAIVQFVPGPATALDVSTPPAVTANVPFSVTVTARDANGNVAETYGGTVHFAVNDTGPTLPADYAFQPLDAGVRTFGGIVLKTVGNRTLTVTDTVHGAISGVALIPVKGATTTTVTSNLNPAGPGVNVTFTATVATTALGGPPSGSVTFKDGLATLGSASLSGGTASFTTNALARRPHDITVVYGGTTNFLTSTSNVLSQYITLAAPAMTATYAASAGAITLTWSADPFAASCEIWRSSQNGAFTLITTITTTTPAHQDFGISPATTYLYRIRFRDSGNNPGDFTFVDLATSIGFIDDPLPTGAAIKAVHPQQLRQAIDAVRASVGLGAAAYTSSLVSGGPIRALDWSEMRSRLDEARALIPNLKPVAAYTDPSITSAVVVKAVHLVDLRARVQ